GEGEAADRGVRADRAQGVQDVGRDLHEVALPDLGRFVPDGHDPASGDHVVELEGRVLVRMHLAAGHHLELADQLEMAAERLGPHLARLEQPPDGHGALMLGRGLDLLDRPDIHGQISSKGAGACGGPHAPLVVVLYFTYTRLAIATKSST